MIRSWKGLVYNVFLNLPIKSRSKIWVDLQACLEIFEYTSSTDESKPIHLGCLILISHSPQLTLRIFYVF